MDTRFLLLARYDGLPIIPLDQIQKDFFLHLSVAKFLRKVSAHQIELPIIRIEASKRSARGVHIDDLANYLDKRRAEAKQKYKISQINA